ncbi:MAG: hypothetical protein EA409_08020 [Saprospirales bacterium]|nr:MAG: hypothetical protein EA409_08020 [Saprospirales bacterium]
MINKILIIQIIAALTFTSIAVSAQSILSTPHFLKAKQEAAEREVNMLVHFTASWSNPCSKMFGKTYRNEHIRQILMEELVFTLVDIDDFDGYVLAQHYNIQNLPTLVLFTPDGRVLRSQRGFMNEEELAEFLNMEIDWEGEILASSKENESPGLMERINDSPENSQQESKTSPETEIEISSSTPSISAKDFYSIQLGAFSQKSNAEQMINNFDKAIADKLLVLSEENASGKRYLLLGGKFQSRIEAERFLTTLRNQGKDGFIKKIDNQSNS